MQVVDEAPQTRERSKRKNFVEQDLAEISRARRVDIAVGNGLVLLPRVFDCVRPRAVAVISAEADGQKP